MTRRDALAPPAARPARVALLGALLLLVPTLAPAASKRGSRPAVQRGKAVRKAPAATAARSRRPAPPPPVYGSRGVDEEHLHVRRGDTLAGLLAARGVGAREAQRWVRAAAAVFDLRRIRPRQGLTLRFDRATRALESLRYEIDGRELLVVRRTDDGIRAERASLPYFTEVKGTAGRIERGLQVDLASAGVPTSVVSELADVFGWELDLDAELRPGDAFRVLYENIWLAGESRPAPGKVIGAQLVAGGRPVTVVYFEDADGRGGYYRPDGEPVSRHLLRYPVEFTEITSEFSLVRRHPITRRRRPHLGVDFAAPTGTPVRAVATGTVLEAGWERALGRCVRIAHPGDLVSTYGHFSQMAEGIAAGTRVERGQVIGYVGASGLATGPHLHFALHQRGEYVDPLAVTGGVESPVPDDVRPAFERVRRQVTSKLAALPEAAAPSTVSLSDAGDRIRE